MLHLPQLPTLGDIAKALIDFAGVLPQKNDKLDVISSEKSKKTIQTQLSRLAKEESELEQNFIELTELLSTFLFKVFKDVKLVNISMAIINEVYFQYKDFVRSDATFLNKKESIKWLLKMKLSDRVILSYQKNALKYNLKSTPKNFSNEQHWWLPGIESNAVKWPLFKTFNWIYSELNINQTHFHFPNFGKEDNYRLAQNLENASRWSNGLKIPSWGSLQQNIEESIQALLNTSNINDRRDINEKQKNEFITALFIARSSTAIFKSIEKNYGNEYLLELVKHIKKQDFRLAKEHSVFSDHLELEISKQSITDKDLIDQIWFGETDNYWTEKSRVLQYNVQAISPRYQKKSLAGFNFQDLKFFLTKLDPFTLTPLLLAASNNIVSKAPANFFDLYLEGFNVRKNAELTLSDISKYEESLKNNNLTEYLAWLLNWIYATYHYRKRHDKLAFPYYKKAFEQAKYAAGTEQYLLVNQYIECCAKNDKKIDFKKGIAWANYVGIKVRWYRNLKDESDEALDITYTYLKMGRYALV
jgi:hypothetical protein